MLLLLPVWTLKAVKVLWYAMGIHLKCTSVRIPWDVM